MRSIYGDGQASVARSQISVGISQAAIQADQIHNGVEAAYENFIAKVGALKQGYDRLAKSCQSLSTVTAAADIGAACRAMEDSVTRFQQSVATTRNAFSHIEEVWRVEHAQQEKIVKAAEASE
jgi:Zn-dependent oligopeptidase